ncbi:hypothetical protein H7992_05095 [Sporosarcina sp. resist]|uniref:hypothetical protein n=1 Tax=Sporosarcina sp. resist TaxID=2762563 RepID=UPI00164DA558|nr:hypothetical protein [Sporosarcina sp. resist]QNK89102.1 hypothetical protein H7992_05095 [Sporosarcina sp. resist]
MNDEENKVGRYYRLSKKTIGKIQDYSKEENMSNAAVIEYAVKQLFENRTEEHKVLIDSLDMLLEKKFDDKLAGVLEGLNRVRVASNVIDRNVQMGLEFWNHYFVVNNAKALGSTDKHKTVQVIEAEELIKKRIGHNRQKKIDWENKRMKSGE